MALKGRGVDKFSLMDMKRYQREKAKRTDFFVSEQQHDQLHGPRTFTYTSIETLDTVAGSKFRPPRGGVLLSVSARVQTAPSGTDFKLDLLIDGFSVFNGYLIIKAGETISKPKYVEPRTFNDDSDFKFQVNTVSAAGGPYVATIEYDPGW